MAMVPSTELQIDIFVTNVKPTLINALAVPSPFNPAAMKSQEPLMPPIPQFLLDSARQPSTDKSADVPEDITARSSFESEAEPDDLVDLSYYTSDAAQGEGELGYDEHVLDLTNFEGDDDTAIPGEAALNDAVKKEGRARRSFFRQTISLGSFKPKSSLESTHLRPVSEAQQPVGGTPLPTSRSTGERPRSMAMLALGRNPRSSMAMNAPLLSPATATTPNSSAPLLSSHSAPVFTFPPPQPHSPAIHSPLARTGSPSPAPPRSPSPLTSDKRASYASSLRPESVTSQWSDVHSLAALVSEAAASDHMRLELEDEELVDLSVVAERTRGGRPAIHRILADEVERAQGSVIVGCCGPTSLNAVVRKNIAAQIDPGRVWRGDMRGSIALVAEDFEY